MFFKLRKLKGQIQAIDEGDMQPDQVAKIATALNVPEKDVVSMNRRLAAPDNSLNAPLRAEGEGEWQDWLVDDGVDQETELAETQELEQRRELLMNAMGNLNDREKHIIMERRLTDEPKTLEELSNVYSISRERVRQIEARSLEKIEHLIEQENHDPAF